VFMADENAGLSLWEVRKMWQALEQFEVVVAKPPLPSASKWSPWKRLASKSRGRFVLAQREAARRMIDAIENARMPGGGFAGLGAGYGEIELGVRKPHIAPRRWMSQARSIFPASAAGQAAAAGHAPHDSTPIAAAAPARSEPKRPNYLNSVRDFAMGE